jgi:hypothetical protein
VTLVFALGTALALVVGLVLLYFVLDQQLQASLPATSPL